MPTKRGFRGNLVQLREDTPLPLPVEALGQRDADRVKLVAWLTKQGFRSTVARLGLDGPAPSKPEATPNHKRRLVRTRVISGWRRRGRNRALGLITASQRSRRFGNGWPRRQRRAGSAWTPRPTGWTRCGQIWSGSPWLLPRGRACYVPLRHEVLGEQIKLSDVIEVLGPLLADPSVLKIFQNAKFDMMMLFRSGFPMPDPVDDTMLISYAQEAGMHGHGLDELSQLHLGHTPISYDEVTGTGRNRVPFAQVPIDRATAYAAEDADVALRLWYGLKPRLRLNGGLALYEQVERRLVPILLEMERAGVKVDADDLRRMSVDFEARMAVMEQDCHRLAGHPFNVGSPKQLGEVLFDEQKLPGGKRMKTGAWGTDSSVLQGLADQGLELPTRILEWRQLQKLKSTYADALITEINPETGRVHTSFAMAIASTGRLSSTDPNLQNIPIRTEEGSRIRRAFIAEPGHVLVSADYSQIELRLLAHVADLPVLKESFANGEDIHARTASEVFGVPMAGMDPMTRRRAKAINSGSSMGFPGSVWRGSWGFHRVRRGATSIGIRTLSRIRIYMERTKEEARIKGYVVSPFGRRCWVPGIADKNGARRAYAERQAINAPLQGGAADIIKRAMVRLPAALKAAGATVAAAVAGA